MSALVRLRGPNVAHISIGSLKEAILSPLEAAFGSTLHPVGFPLLSNTRQSQHVVQYWQI